LNKIFDIYLAKTDVPGSEAYARLDLPALPWTLLDTLDKLRLRDGEEMYLEIDNYYDFGFLAPYFEDKPCSLYELNALALKLGELDARQSAAFEGLVKVEVSKNQGPLSMSRLIDLAYSADCCHVVPEVKNDFELGGFYAGNGFVPSVDGLSDELFEMLDFEKIGRDLRRGEGGVFTSGGYVVQHEDLNEVYKNLDLTPPHKPDYQILLEVSLGHFGDPEYDNDNLVQLKLPASSHAINAMLNELCAASVEEIGWRCLDCRIPALMDAVTDAESFGKINSFAVALFKMNDEQAMQYKTVIEATECKALTDAEELRDHIGEHIFNRNISSPIEMACLDLSLMMDEDKAARLKPFVDLYGYGKSVITKYNATLTAYGAVSRKDLQPVQTISETQAQKGMEMV
jgi:hypothetical protein